MGKKGEKINNSFKKNSNKTLRGKKDSFKNSKVVQKKREERKEKRENNIIKEDIALQWYPGHMTKAKRMMEKNKALVDLIVEILDARIPESSRNPDIKEFALNKDRLIILNKKDLACDTDTKKWEDYYKEKGFSVLSLDSKTRNGYSLLISKIEEASVKKRERDERKGILKRPVRAMIVGIPNVGKSTIINMLSGKKVAEAGNKPGVTKGKQWIRLNDFVDVLDTPGVLWPKFSDQKVAIRLALTGSIKEEVMPMEELAFSIVKNFRKDKSCKFLEYYGLEDMENEIDLLEEIGRKRGYLLKGGRVSLEKVSRLVFDDFKNGKLGKITLDKVEEYL